MAPSKRNIPAREARCEFPDLPYRPRDPVRRDFVVGLIGCGGITGDHLQAYRTAGYRVAQLCDVSLKAADARRDEFYPDAKTTADYRAVLADPKIDVVDIATHPEVRTPIVTDALRAGKHVLCQKPFVLDLSTGEQLADLADQGKVRLAVNQNARWAPHFSWLREAVAAGLVGDVSAVHCAVSWDHTWVVGTSFEKIPHLILYDFAIHWFDFLTTLFADRQATRVYAATARTSAQPIDSPLLAHVTVEYPQGQATLVFAADTPHGSLDHAYIAGSAGSLRSFGRDSNHQTVELHNEQGAYRPRLEGSWFPDGFHGTMGELLCAIEEDREPAHGARGNLKSLELCFAAVASAERGEPVTPGSVGALLG
ncbi:Gfo/Idh/MocA family oxidoreductase, partial [Pirellulales bacterium]|nr:Gfo/Idh/MocA family oxidoreductase [Pirellulales bacterium]